MRISELRRIAECAVCKRGVMHNGLPFFYRVTVERHGIQMRAVQQQAGLEMMLGGNVAIAEAMGPDPDATVTLMEPTALTVCETCSHQQPILMQALEAQADADDTAVPR